MVGSSKEPWDNMRIYFIGFLLLVPFLMIAQYPPAGGDTSLVTTDSIQLPPFQYRYFHPGNPGQVYVNTDTTLGNFFQDADPARRKKFNDLNTGNVGSMGISPLFEFKPIYGFNSGYRAYDAFNYTADSLRFYDSERPMADLYFSPIFGSQQNFVVGAEYGQKFSDGLAISLNYKRLSQSGFYQNQGTRTTNLATAVRWTTMAEKLDFVAGFISNTNNEQHNGGVDTAVVVRASGQFRINVPVNLSETKTRYDQQVYFLYSTLSLDGKPAAESRFAIGHKLDVKTGYSNYYDVDLSTKSDTLFYNDYLIDTRGIRNRVSLTQWSNSFLLRSQWKKADGTLALVYDNFSLNDGVNQKSINDLTLRFDGKIAAGKTLDIFTRARLGLGANAGSFLAEGNTTITLGKLATLDGSVSFFNSQATWNQEFLALNMRAVYNDPLNNVLGTRFSAGISLPWLGLHAGLSQQIIDNYVYRNEVALPVQHDGNVQITSATISQHWKWKSIHLESHAFWQRFNVDFIALPELYVKSNLYLERFFFRRNLLLRTGLEVKYIPDFVVPEFDVVTGTYYKGDQSYQDQYYSADFYILGKVSKFRIFFKFENIQEYLNNRLNYLAVFHPQFDNRMRLGFRWLLLD